MWSLFLAAAFAQEDEGMEAPADLACMPLQVTKSAPASGAIDVPVDVQPVLVFEGNNCGGASEWTIAILDADGAELHAETWTWDGSIPALATITPAEPLPADADLRIVASGNSGYYYGNADIAFRTGSGTVQGVAGAPAAELTSAVWFRDGQSANVTVHVTPAADPDGLSIVRIEGGESAPMYYLPSELAAFDPTLSWFEPSEPDELCATVVQIDGTGAESEPVEACAAPDIENGDPNIGGRGGCFGGGRGNDVAVVDAPPPAETEPAAFVALAGLGFLLRRRSRR